MVGGSDKKNLIGGGPADHGGESDIILESRVGRVGPNLILQNWFVRWEFEVWTVSEINHLSYVLGTNLYS
jgi:hypothetical protein